MQKDASLTLITGRRGSGKSTRAKAMTKGKPKVVVFDPLDEYTGGKIVKCYSLPEVGRAIRRLYGRGFAISYVPSAGGEAECLHRLTSALWQVQSPYEDGRDARKLTLVVEEMDLSFPSHKIPTEFSGMSNIVNRGRHVGIEVVGVTQRPAQVSKTFRGNVLTTYVFPLAEEDDQQAMLKRLGKRWKEPLRTLANHHCLMAENGQVTAFRQSKSGLLTPVSLRT